jgi:hypothetical protein
MKFCALQTKSMKHEAASSHFYCLLIVSLVENAFVANNVVSLLILNGINLWVYLYYFTNNAQKC